MQRRFITAFAVFAFGLSVFASSPPAAGQDGWITLLDGAKMGDWDRIGEANWRIEDGAVVADKKTGKEAAYLVSKIPYKDFMLRAEFWGERRRQFRHFHSLSGPGEDRCGELL